jgi:hypothetical protein
MLLDSVARAISSMVVSLKFAGSLHSCASASCTSSSIISETSALMPTFSSSAACDGVSSITLIGWKAIGLKRVRKDAQRSVAPLRRAYPIILSYCC